MSGGAIWFASLQDARFATNCRQKIAWKMSLGGNWVACFRTSAGQFCERGVVPIERSLRPFGTQTVLGIGPRIASALADSILGYFRSVPPGRGAGLAGCGAGMDRICHQISFKRFALWALAPGLPDVSFEVYDSCAAVCGRIIVF